MPLMKVKRAICETMQVEGEQIVIGMADKKVFCINGTDLQFLATLMPSGVIQWELEVCEAVMIKHNCLVVLR